MSKENVKLFYEALGKDKALQEKTKAISQKYAGQKLDEAEGDLIYQKELVPLAKEAGYDFTLAELKDYSARAQKTGMREVSEEELATVAGGGVCVCVLYGAGDWGYGGVRECQCTMVGQGYYNGDYRCGCFAGGGGG